MLEPAGNGVSDHLPPTKFMAEVQNQAISPNWTKNYLNANLQANELQLIP